MTALINAGERDRIAGWIEEATAALAALSVGVGQLSLALFTDTETVAGTFTTGTTPPITIANSVTRPPTM